MTVKDTVKDTAHRAGETVRETYETTKARAGEAYDNAAAKTGEIYAGARERATAAGQRTAETVDNNPLPAVIGGLAVGMLIGSLLPKTRREREWLGPYGSEITGRARDAAQAARAVGAEKLDEFGFIKDAARDTAKKALDNAKAVASEAGSAAVHKAKRED